MLCVKASVWKKDQKRQVWKQREACYRDAAGLQEAKDVGLNWEQHGAKLWANANVSLG